MTSEPSMPDGLVTLARDCVELGLHVVTRRDTQAGFLEFSVPYRATANPRIYAYRISKQGSTISACPLGVESAPCRLTPIQQDELLLLCATIEKKLTDAASHLGAARAAIQT